MVPGVAVRIIGPSLNSEAVTNPVGAWSFTNLPAGSYVVQVLAPGFQTYTRTGVKVAPGSAPRLDANLTIGGTVENITITAPGTPRPPAPPAAPGTPQRVRVGGNVQPPRLIRQTNPEYPESARAQGVEGSVTISAIVGANGNVLEAQVIDASLVPADLAAAALAAVRTWQYQPAQLNGQPVQVITTITLNFRLQ